MRSIFITGTAGFIGFHLAKLLLSEGHRVYGFDALTDYYDVALKKKRHDILHTEKNFTSTIGSIEDIEILNSAIAVSKPSAVIHLAAQAGVRYSIENPQSYVDANIIGSFNVMECARQHDVDHLLMASTSSVYGANTQMPYKETDKCDTQMSFYAATKKANEAMAHSWAHIHHLPTTMFRFFTVYGPWGRPDMALSKFTKNIMADTPIDVYNRGEMWRDFTYVDDIARGIRLLIDAVPPMPEPNRVLDTSDTVSSVAPFRVVNIGASKKTALIDYISAIENALGKKGTKRMLPIQAGDVPATWSDIGQLKALTGFEPLTGLQEGVDAFVSWYKSYYHPET